MSCPFCNAVAVEPNRAARRRAKRRLGTTDVVAVVLHESGCPLSPGDRRHVYGVGGGRDRQLRGGESDA